MVPHRGPRDHRPAVGNRTSGGGPAVDCPRGGARGVERGAHRAGAAAGARASGAPREGEVRDGREALLVGAQREQQVRDAVAARQLGVVARARSSSRRAGRPAATSSAPASPTSHVPSAPALEHEPGPRVQLARVVADEVAEQAERGALGRAVARGAFGRTTFAPRCA